MLSGETAAGKYPVEAVKTMANIAKRTEETLKYNELLKDRKIEEATVTNAISYATCATAADLNAKAIISFTTSGHTARMVSKFRPQCPIIATTEDEGVMRRLALVWGVYPVKTSHVESTDDLFTTSIVSAKEQNYLVNGDLVVITAGVPSGKSGTTNLIKVHTIEE